MISGGCGESVSRKTERTRGEKRNEQGTRARKVSNVAFYVYISVSFTHWHLKGDVEKGVLAGRSLDMKRDYFLVMSKIK